MSAAGLAPLVLANLGRDRLRTALTVAAIAFAIALGTLLRTLPNGMQRMLDEFASSTRISVTSEAGSGYRMPYAHLARIAVLDGVEAVASWTWFGGAHDVDEGVVFPTFAIEPEGLAGVWPDWAIAPEVHAAFARERSAAIVGRATLDQQGWKVGDRVSLVSSIHPVTLEFRIVGAIEQTGNPIFYAQREYLAQAVRATGAELQGAGNLWVRASGPHVVPALQREIEELFRNSAAGAVAQTERSFLGATFGFLEDFLLLVLVVTVLIAACVAFIAGNTASLAIRERHGEIAVMRALGFGRRTLFSLLVAETMLVGALAGALGVGAAGALTRTLRASDFAQRFPVLGGFEVTATIALASLAFALAIGAVAGLLPSVQAMRLDPAEALRRLD